MAQEESFLLLSLKGSKAKKVAQVVSNANCQKILEYLSKNDNSTESDIAENLKLPLSTVHYNLKQLIDSKLVKSDEYHYSKKGKEVSHYTLAKKYIIIAPDESDSFLDKLKNILPAFLALGITSLALAISSIFFAKPNEPMLAAKSLAQDAVIESVTIAPMRVAEVQSISILQIALWFFIGGLFTIMIYLIFQKIKSK